MLDSDKSILEFLKHRIGKATIAKMKSGTLFTIWNIVSGYDIGDEAAHITTNINPTVQGAEIDFFFTYDIAEFIDPDSGERILVGKDK